MPNLKKNILAPVKNMKTMAFTNPAIKFFIALVIVQLIATMTMTNAKRLSIAGMLRNVYAGVFFYFFHKTHMNVVLNVFLSLVLAHVACFITSIIEVKLTTLPLIDDHVTTAYLYDDVLNDGVVKSANQSTATKNIIKNYSEWCFEPHDMGIDFDDTSPENANVVYTIGKQTFMAKHDASLSYTINGKDIDMGALEQESEYRKYDWFLSHVGINEHTRILELGFGNMAFMQYARSKNVPHVEGINLSSVHCKLAEAEGFKVYHADVNDIDKLDIGKYDMILNNGMLEHLVTKSTRTIFNPKGSDEEVYTAFMTKINNCLKPGGTFVNTIITSDDTVEYNPTLLTVWYGNNGLYPDERVFIQSAKNAGMHLKVSHDKTLHYYMSQTLRGTVQLNTVGQSSFLKHLFMSLAHPNVIASHVCYNGLPDACFSREAVYNSYSWIHHFVPNSTDDGRYLYGTQLTKHRWIVFKK
jgi:cyclopropane fatty-acyl-phospholipid synthase-like methyltransferase